MGNRLSGWTGLLGIVLWLGIQGGAEAQAPSDGVSPPPQTIYRLQGSEPVSTPESSTPVQQSDPQATLTRESQTAAPSDPLERQGQAPSNAAESAIVDPLFSSTEDPAEDPATDQLTESDPVFQLDLRLQGESTVPSQGSGPAGSGLPGRGQGGTEAGTGGMPGTLGGPGSVTGPGTTGSGSQGSGPSTGTGPGAPGSGINSSEAASAQRYPETTGLIVDARGLDFQPSMSMRLFDPEGNQVYTTPTANQELNTYLVASAGTAAYASSEEQALNLVQRIGEKPLQIEAIKTLGYDLVISNEDAWELRQRNQVDKFLDEYAVVVIWETPD